MKKLLFIISVLFIISLSTQAQNNDSLMVKKSYPGFTILKGLALELGTAYIEDESAINVPDIFNVRTGRPSTINIYFFKKIKLIQEYFSIAPGIGFGLDNYFFENDLIVNPAGDSLFFIDDNPNRDYKKSKISANYIDIPVEFQFSSSKNYKKGFKVAIGGKFGVLFSGKSKIKYEVDDTTVKTKYSNTALKRIRYGLSARVGYGNFNIFGYYSLSPLFKDKYSHEVNPIIFGLSITSF